MKILVACEESQAVTIELRRLGHEAYSCDIIECSGGHPEWHIMQDVLPLLNGCCSFKTMDGTEHAISEKWDMLIAHPPCTYLSNAGARHLWKNHTLQPERVKLGILARDFFMRFWLADIPKIAIENPVPSTIFCLPKYTQSIQPYEFGHPVTKKTCLWLKNLPELTPSSMVEPEKGRIIKRTDGSTRYSCWCMEQGKSVSGIDRQRLRSKTFPGIAKAMAEQWAGQAERSTQDEDND